MMSTIPHFKIKPPFLGILLLAVVTILTGGCQKTTQQEGFRLAVDKQKSQVTLHASQIPLSTILKKFERDYQIIIVVPDFQDRKVSIAASDQPLNSVIKQILPEGKRYWIVAEKDVLDIKGSTEEKVGKKYRASKELPEKDVTKGSLISPDAGLKMEPDKVTLFVSQGEKGTKKKPNPDRMMVGKGPQDSGKQPVVAPAGRYLRLRLRVKDGEFTLEKIMIMQGTYIPPEYIQGKYLFSATSNSQVLAVGSFRDPLEIHSYFPDPKQPHEPLRLETATVDLDLPEIVLRKENINKFQIGIYTLSAPPTSPKLTPKTFREFEKLLQKTSVLPNQRIYEKLKTHLQKRPGEQQ